MSNTVESTVLDDFLKHEQEINYASREKETILSGQNLLIGTVVSKATLVVPTTGTLGSGTNGTCTSVTGGVSTTLGTYKATCTTANAADAAGVWRIEAPNGAVLGDLTVTQGEAGTGSFTDPQINLTISYATGYSTIGDYFNIAVTAGTGKCVAVDFDAVDGTQTAVGVVVADYDASSADVEGSVVSRNAILAASPLVWRIEYTSGGTTELEAQDTLTGLTTTTTTCRVLQVTLSSGTWAGCDAAGFILVDQLNADFAAENAEINDSGTNDITLVATDIAGAKAELDALGMIIREEA